MSEKSGEKDKAGVGDLFASVVGLGEATTKFAINQVQNAVGALTHPHEAIDRVKESIDHFSQAMNGTVAIKTEETVAAASEPSRASDALSGRKQ